MSDSNWLEISLPEGDYTQRSEQIFQIRAVDDDKTSPNNVVRIKSYFQFPIIDLGFYGLVSTVEVMLNWSFKLYTLFLGKLSSLSC